MYVVDQRKNILIYNTHRSTQMYCCRSLDVSHQRSFNCFYQEADSSQANVNFATFPLPPIINKT
jgi:hypothetical protein